MLWAQWRWHWGITSPCARDLWLRCQGPYVCFGGNCPPTSDPNDNPSLIGCTATTEDASAAVALTLRHCWPMRKRIFVWDAKDADRFFGENHPNIEIQLGSGWNASLLASTANLESDLPAVASALESCRSICQGSSVVLEVIVETYTNLLRKHIPRIFRSYKLN